MTIVYSHTACLDHDTTANHPEHADRLRAIEAALAGRRDVDRREAPLVDMADILRAHPQNHIDAVHMFQIFFCNLNRNGIVLQVSQGVRMSGTHFQSRIQTTNGCSRQRDTFQHQLVNRVLLEVIVLTGRNLISSESTAGLPADSHGLRSDKFDLTGHPGRDAGGSTGARTWLSHHAQHAGARSVDHRTRSSDHAGRWSNMLAIA